MQIVFSSYYVHRVPVDISELHKITLYQFFEELSEAKDLKSFLSLSYATDLLLDIFFFHLIG